MNVYYFNFRSVTFAQSAKALLDRNGVAATLQRTPRALQQNGCGYSVRVRAASFEAARKLIRQANAVFLVRPDGSFEAVRL